MKSMEETLIGLGFSKIDKPGKPYGFQRGRIKIQYFFNDGLHLLQPGIDFDADDAFSKSWRFYSISFLRDKITTFYKEELFRK